MLDDGLITPSSSIQVSRMLVLHSATVEQKNLAVILIWRIGGLREDRQN